MTEARAEIPPDDEFLMRLCDAGIELRGAGIFPDYNDARRYFDFTATNFETLARALRARLVAGPPALRVGQWTLAQFLMEIPKEHTLSAVTVAGHIVDHFDGAVLVGNPTALKEV